MNSATTVRPASRLFGSLDPRDRRLLLICVGIVVLVALVVAILVPPEDDSNPVPSTFAFTAHGARAAYLALAQSGYRIERWERPLDELAAQSDAHTVLILAGPSRPATTSEHAAVAKFLQRGGRVLATGLVAASLLPDNQAEFNPQGLMDDCTAQPEGFDPLADSGVIHIRPTSRWRMDLPEQRAQYICNGNAVVVSYAVGKDAVKGHVVWWANSLPLENAAIAQDGNLALLLRSIGPADGTRIVWDESLHGDARGLWSYAEGTPVHLLWAQLALLGLLLILSYSRRSGPLLADPTIARDAPLEFVHSLGALYDKAGATNTAVRIAYDRFRLMLGRQTGPQAGMGPVEQSNEIVGLVQARLGHAAPHLRKEILDCEEVAYAAEPLTARRALSLVQSLWAYEEEMRKGGKRHSAAMETENPN